MEEHASLPSLDRFSAKQESRASRLAAKVAERYANAPSYSEILAAEARAAALAAEAAVAAAEQARDRAQALLAGLESPAETLAASQSMRRQEAASPAMMGRLGSALRVRGGSSPRISPGNRLPTNLFWTWAKRVRSAPVQPLPVNLIEFPRELVAPRRARPRLEEGPLRESLDDADGQPPLRIFEAEPDSISQAANADSAAAEWSSIRLDAKPSPL